MKRGFEKIQKTAALSKRRKIVTEVNSTAQNEMSSDSVFSNEIWEMIITELEKNSADNRINMQNIIRLAKTDSNLNSLANNIFEKKMKTLSSAPRTIRTKKKNNKLVQAKESSMSYFFRVSTYTLSEKENVVSQGLKLKALALANANKFFKKYFKNMDLSKIDTAIITAILTQLCIIKGVTEFRTLLIEKIASTNFITNLSNPVNIFIEDKLTELARFKDSEKIFEIKLQLALLLSAIKTDFVFSVDHEKLQKSCKEKLLTQKENGYSAKELINFLGLNELVEAEREAINPSTAIESRPTLKS